jgi:hypothetical protein
MNKLAHHIVFDVESDGPCPGLFNLISFGLVSLADPLRGFLGEVAPLLNHGGLEDARAISGVSLEAQQRFEPAEIVMRRACDWVHDITGGKRAIFWSDNPAFDWQFWNYYCHRFAGDNPAGFSARRIGDFDAGRRGEILNTNAWKKRRITGHTHNPLDDARGNAEALNWIFAQIEKQ